MVEDTVAQMEADGVRRALVFPTSAYGGYSACRQYDEDIVRARAAVGRTAPELVKLRQFFDHPLFIAAFADAVPRPRLNCLPGAYAAGVHGALGAGLGGQGGRAAAEGGDRYSRRSSRLPGWWPPRLGVTEYDVVWQSRSGPPQVPWLEPDIVDHIDALHAKGVHGVVVCPIGFVSATTSKCVGPGHRGRASGPPNWAWSSPAPPRPNADPRFAELVVELVAEHTSGAPARKLSAFATAGCTVNGAPCAPCAASRRKGPSAPSLGGQRPCRAAVSDSTALDGRAPS